MLVKTEQGQTLSTCNTFSNLVDHASAGETYIVRWGFVCTMNPGIFYTNCGVTMSNGNDFEYLNRIVDAIVFKVVKDKGESGGLVSLNQTVDFGLVE